MRTKLTEKKQSDQSDLRLHKVILQQDYQQLKTLLPAEQALLNAQDEQKRTPFMIAIKLGLMQFDLISQLITPANFNTADDSGATPIMIACAMRRIDIVKLIIVQQARQLKLGDVDPNVLTPGQLKKLSSFINQVHPKSGKSLGFYALTRHGVAEDLTKNEQITVMTILNNVGADAYSIVKTTNNTYALEMMQFTQPMIVFLHQCGLNFQHKQQNGKTLVSYLEGLKDPKFEKMLTPHDKKVLSELADEVRLLSENKPNARSLTQGYFKIGSKDFSNEHDRQLIARSFGSVACDVIHTQDQVRFDPQSSLMIFQNESCYINTDHQSKDLPIFITTVDLSQCILIHFYNQANDHYVCHFSRGSHLDLNQVRRNFKDPNELNVAIYGGCCDDESYETLSSFLYFTLEYWRKNTEIKLTLAKQLILANCCYQRDVHNVDNKRMELEQATIWLQGRFGDLRQWYGITDMPAVKLNFTKPMENFMARSLIADQDTVNKLVAIVTEPISEINPARDQLIKTKNYLPMIERVLLSKEAKAPYLTHYRQGLHLPEVSRLTRCGIQLATNRLFIAGAAVNREDYLLKMGYYIDVRLTKGNRDLEQIYSSKDRIIVREKISPSLFHILDAYRNLFHDFRQDVQALFVQNIAALTEKELINEAAQGLNRNEKIYIKYQTTIEALLRELGLTTADTSLFYRMLCLFEILEKKPELITDVSVRPK